MATKIEKKTILIISGIIVCLILALFFGLHILEPALDPITRDMTKIFLCGAGCGLLLGLWLGRRIERFFRKEEDKASMRDRQ